MYSSNYFAANYFKSNYFQGTISIVPVVGGGFIAFLGF